MLYHPGLKLFVGPPWRVFWLLLTSPLGKKSVRVWVLRKYAAPYLGSKPKLMYAQYSCIDFPRLRFTSRKTYLPAQAKHPFLNYMPTPPDTPLWVKIYDPPKCSDFTTPGCQNQLAHVWGRIINTQFFSAEPFL